MTDELRCVSQGFNRTVNKYEKYDVNGFRFHTEDHQKSRPNAKTINTGVYTRGARGGDGDDCVDYYGRLERVYELTFNRTNVELKLVVFKCHWFDPKAGHKSDPSIGLVEVKPSTTYSGADVYIVAHQAKQVYYLPYPCKNDRLKDWQVVFRVSPHGKLPMPSADDYNNINPVTYEGIFYQEQEDFGDFGLHPGGLEEPENNVETDHGEAVSDLKDINMLLKLQANNDRDDDEPPPFDEPPTYYSRDSDTDSENENPHNYESDNSR